MTFIEGRIGRLIVRSVREWSWSSVEIDTSDRIPRATLLNRPYPRRHTTHSAIGVLDE